ncbi:MAG TPA: hypothetical protein DCX01_06155 [Bacteroidetes bacterium]|nr:hypothetical protein [Bacteroidota bacterium]
MSGDWWLQNLDQVLRSAGYLVPGSIAFKGASLVGKQIIGQTSKVMSNAITGQKAAQVLNAGSALGSATMLNYSEHAKSAEMHIADNLEELTQFYVTQGQDFEQARGQASKVLSGQAADIIKGGRVNILWQSISQANLFRGVAHSRKFGILKEGTKNRTAKDAFQKLAVEVPTEAAEEVTTGFFETEAEYELAREMDKTPADYRPAYERFAEHVTSYRGITEGLLGALGSVPLSVGSSIMQKKSNIDALDQIKKTKTALGASGEEIRNLNKQQVREHAIFNSLRGTMGNFMEILETYKNASAEEASDLGFESNYKELADEYTADAKFIEDVINNELMNPLRNNEAEAFILVNNRLNEYYALEQIQKYKNEINELEAKREKLFSDIENNVEDRALHDMRNAAIQRGALERTIQQFKDGITELEKENRPHTKEYNETLQGEQKNLKDAEAKLKALEATLVKNINDYSNSNDITAQETAAKIAELESAGDIDSQVELYKSMLEGAKIRRKNNTERYEELVANPDILKQEGEKAIKEAQKQKEEEEKARKAKQKIKRKQENKAAEEKTKQEDAIKQKQSGQPKSDAQAMADQEAPLTAGAPFGAPAEGSPVVDKASDLEQKRQEELEALSFDKATQMQLDSYKKKDKARYTRELINAANKSAKGSKIVNKYAAQIKLLDPNATIAERVMAKKFLEDGGAYSLAELSQIEGSINNILSEEINSDYDNLVKAFYDAEVKAAAEKESVSPDQPQAFSSPVFDGDVNNGGEDLEGSSEINQDNSNITPKSFNPYFEVNEENQKGRQTNSSSSVAYLSVPYRRVDIDGTVENRSLSNTKTEDSKLVESSTALPPGSEVTLKLVDGSDVPVTKDRLKAMKDEDVDKLAVAIYQNGKKVGSLHTTKWIEAKDTGGNLINTAPGNLEQELQKAKNIRRAIARTADENSEIKTKVAFKGHGKVLPLYAEDSTTGNLLLIDGNLQKINKSVDAAFPDADNVQLGVVNGGNIYVGEFALKEETVIDLNDGNYTDGRVVANLPTPNGKVFPTILFVDNITEGQANTIIGAATSFQNQQTETYDTITDETGIQFGREGDAEGLHKFVNRYVHSKKSFYRLDTTEEGRLAQGSILVHTPQLAASQSGQVQGMLQIIDVDNRIMYTNDPLFFENNPQFVTNNKILQIKDLRKEADSQEASKLLQQKLANVKSDAINKPGTFKDVSLNIDGSVDGVSTHSSYNAFKAQQLKTDINGTNFIQKNDGTREYTYMTQPIVVLDTSFAEDNGVREDSEDANDSASELSFASPVFEGQSERDDEAQIENYKDDAIAKAMREQLSERFFDTKIISLTQQVEAIDSMFATYSKNITNHSFQAISKLIKAELQKEVDKLKIQTKRKLALQHLLENYDAKAGKVTVEGIMLEKLAKLSILPIKEGFRSKDLTDAQIDEIFAEALDSDGFTQEDFVKEIYDFEFYKTNKKMTASSSIKLLLSGVTKNEKSWLGKNFKKGVAYQESYDTLKATLARVPGTFKDQLQAIQKRAQDSNNPVYDKVLKLLEGVNTSESLKRQFVVAMSGTRLNFVFLKVEPTVLGGKSRVMEVDRYNTTVNIKNKWFSNLLDSKLTKTMSVGGIPEVIINQAYREKLQSDYREQFIKYRNSNQLNSDEFVRIVQKYLNEMGIEVPFEGLKFLANPKTTAKDRNIYLRRSSKWSSHVDPDLTTGGAPKGMMSSLFKSFRIDEALFSEQQLKKLKTDKQTRQELEENKEAFETLVEAEKRGGFIYTTNPYDGPNYEKVVYGLLGLTVDFEGAIYGDSFRDSKGNMIYPYQNHFGISRMLSDYVTDKEQLDSLLKLSYNQNSVWGKGLQNDSNYLEVVMFDATNFNNNVTNRNEQGKFLQEVSFFNAFANQGNADGYFFPITTADKDVAPLIKAPKLKDIAANLVVQEGQVIDINEQILEQIYGYAFDEYNRIKNYKKIEGVNRGPYEQGAEYFYMFNYLNAYTAESKDVMDMTTAEAEAYIRETVKQNVIAQINSHIARLKELGVETKFLDQTYIRKNFAQQTALYKTKEDRLAGAIADYNLNYIVSNNEIVKLFGNDPAHAYKRSKKDGATLKDHIKETLNNYEKRKADLISPASTPQYTTPNVTIATAMDAIKDGIERTDAQEYGTISELIESKLSSGKLPEEVANRILKAYKDAIADPNNPRNFFKLKDVLTEQEIEKYKKVLMADKPVFVQNDIRPDQDSNNRLFRKSHIRYLWPEETTALGLDDLRVAMETVGIDRLGHLSSDKTGAVNPVEIYDATGKVKPLEEVIELLKTGSRVIKRAGLGIQQEKGAADGAISFSTQLDVLLFDDMLGKTLSTGESYADLRDQKEALMIRFMKLGAKKLFNKLGIQQNEDGSTYIPNPTTLAKMLKEEAISRNWSFKDISELELKDVQEAVERVFKSPLTFNHARKNIDSLVLSLINKEITKIKLPGESLVQASSAGFEARGGSGWDGFVSDGSFDKIRNGITFLETENAFDESVGLQGTRVKNGKVLSAQILLSPVFTDSKANTIDLTSKKYTTIKNGVRYLKADMLPQELRERILYRIPGQGKPSVSPVEIVGFLPRSSTSTVIVPDSVIDQMGSDFDWDTAYTYMKQYEVTEDNKIVVKSEISELEQLQDEYYELFKKIIFDKTTVNATTKLDNLDLKTTADIVDNIVGEESMINDPSYVTTNIDNTISQRTGKQLIGPASLAAVMHAALQGKGITINISSKTLQPTPFVFFEGGSKNKTLELTTISSYGGKSTPTAALADAVRTASDNIRTIQNAAVDNANEAVLARAGINNATIDVALFTLMYKDTTTADSIHAEQLVYFLRQEAINIYSEQFDYYSAQIEGGFRSEEQIRNDAFNATMTKLAEKAGIDAEEDYTNFIDEYRKGSDGEFRTFSSQDFIDQLRTSNKPNPSYYRTQMAILAGFKQLQNSSDPIRKLQRGIMSPRTKGIGSTIFDAQRAIDNMEEIFDKGLRSIGGLENLQGGQLEEMYNQFAKVYDSLSSILPFSNRSHKQMIGLWQQFTGVENVSQKTREELFNALLNKSFSRAFEKTFNEDIVEARHRLTTNIENNIATRVAEIQKTEFGKRNLFISRLIPINANAGVPASISYVNSKQDDIADQMAVDFVALYESVIPGHRELFEDIVKYTYITGGVQSAGNFSKFMNTAYLDQVGFYDSLRQEERLLNSPTSPEAPNIMEVMVEFLQHNPHRAVTLSEKDFKKMSVSPIQTIDYNNKTINYEFTLKQPDASQELNRILYADDEGTRRYIEVIAIEGKTENELFQKMGVDENGDIVFRRIGKKGFQTSSFVKVNEYAGVDKFTKDGIKITEQSVLPQNNVPKPLEVGTRLPEISKDTPPVDKSVLGLDPVSMTVSSPGRAGVKEVLNAVSEETTSETQALLSKILLSNIDTKGSAIKQIVIEDGIKNREGKGAYGAYRPKSGTVSLDRDTIIRHPHKLQETILHEILHGFLVEEIANPDSEFSRKIKYLTKAANTAFKAAVKRGDIVKGTLEYKILEYAFSNPQEFVTNVMTKSQVQSFLNTVPAKKNLFTRFKELVTEFLNSIGIDLGIDINKDSLLAEAVNDIMTFITETPASNEVKQVVKKAEDNAAGVLPLNLYLDEAAHVLASYEKIKSGEYTQEEFKEAMQQYRYQQLLSPVFTGRKPDLQAKISTVEELLSVYRERADKLKSKLTDKVLTTKEGKKMQERLNKYEDEISTLSSNKAFGSLERIISIHLAFAQNIASAKNPTKVELKEALNIVDMYDYGKVTSKYLDVKDRTTRNRFNNLLKESSDVASGIKVRLLDNLVDMAVEVINAEMPETEQVVREDLIAMEGENTLKTSFLDLSKFQHPIVRTLDKFLKSANRNSDSEIQARFMEIESAMDDIRNNPAFKKDPNIFFQKNEKGELTGYFISPYSSKYNTVKNKAFARYYKRLQNAKTPAAKNTATALLYRDLNKIEVTVDIRWFIDGVGKFNSPFKSKEEYIEYLDGQVGGAEAREELVENAIKKYNKYKIAEEQRMLDIELEVSGSAGNLQEFQEEINSKQRQYKERHSPIYYLNARYGGGKALSKNTGYKATVSAPVGNKQYYDKNYQEIQNNPELKKFHDFYTNTMKDLMTLLPEGLVSTLPENFFPYARRGFVEQVSNEGVDAIFSAMKKTSIKDYLFNIDQEITLDPQIATKGVRNPDTGEIEKNVPVRMLKGDSKEKSYDIEKVMKMFTAMSVAYDYKSQVEDKILLLQRVLREAEEIQMDSKGDPMKRKVARKLKLDSKIGGLKTTQAAVKYAIDSKLYGVSTDMAEKGIVFSREVAEIKQEFENLKTKLAAGEIDDSTYLQEKSVLDERLKKLGKKPKSLKKPLERLVQYTQLKGLGWNLMSGINNLSFGTIANFVHAAGNEDYTTAQLTKAYAVILKQHAPGIASKAQKLAEKYGILFEQLDAYYGKNKNRTRFKFISKVDPFYFQTSTEYMNQVAPMVAKMYNTKIDDKGNTLYDMYDDDANIKPEFKDVADEWTSKLDAETKNKFTAFRDATIEMNKVNHGNYDPNSALLIKKTIWGRLGTQFRTWAFEGINTRWGEKVYNAQLERYTEGRYKAYSKVGFKGSLEMLIKSILNTLTLGYGVSDASMRGDIKDDLTFANMRKNMAGVKFYLAVTGAGALLKALGEDEDDEDTEKTLRLLQNTFFRLEQDGEFYMNPGTAAEVLRNPAPVMKTIKDATNAISATQDYIIDKEGYEDSRRDPLSKKWMKVVPFGNSIRSIDYLMETQIEKD